MSAPDTDRNLLFGVLALQADLIDAARFAEACTAWSARKNTPLADLIVERGWLTPPDRADVEKLLRRKLAKHGGDARASLAEVTGDEVRQSLAGVPDADVQQSLTPPPTGHVLIHTANYVPEVRERYTLSRLHATGGIGRVWLARDASLGRDVALKELRPERAGQPAVWGRFLREAKVTGQLEHPGIVPVYELGRRPDDDAPFYTMRFVRGRTLAEAARAYHERRQRGEAGPLELRELLTAFVGVCNAVAYAHSRGVLHRDLKPQNVVLGDYGEVMVLDWGLAKVMGEAEGDAAPVELRADEPGDGTMAGQVLGTPAYMAPEQAEGRLDLLDARTDVYGLGAVLYEVLAGRPPFAGPDTTAVLRRVVHDAPEPPRAAVPATPPALAAVCLKALAKRPADRYAAVKKLAAEVRHWLADEPVTAFREPPVARAGRWARQHRTLVATAAVALLAALGGLGAVLAVQARANYDLRAANERETARFDLAMEAIKLFHGEVSEDLLLKEKQFDGLRTKLLRGAADFYGKLEDLLQGQTDRRSRAALGQAYHELGELTTKIGSKPGALAVHQKALAVRRELAAAPEADPETAADVARSLMAIALLHEAIGNSTEALAAFEEARAILQKLTDVNPAVPRISGHLAQCLSDMGNLLWRTGQPAVALASHEKARAIRQALTETNPAVTQFQSDLAMSFNNIGVLLTQTGQLAEAMASYEKARAIRQPLADAHPAVTQFQSDLAQSHANIGLLLSSLGQPAAALASHEKARAIQQVLADTYPAVNQFQRALARSHSEVSRLLSRTGRTAEAMASYEKARAIQQALADANPVVTQFQSDLASSHARIGEMLSQSGKPAEALAAHEQASAIRQKLADANPTVTRVQHDLAMSYNQVGEMLGRCGRWDEAATAYQRALTIAEPLARANPADTDYQRVLTISLSRLGILQQRGGRPAAAVASLRQAAAILERLPTLTSGNHYDLACCYALLAGVAASGLTAAEGQAAADKAMDHLRRAVAAGIRNVAALRTDTDFDALRPREDFQKLMQELEAKRKSDGK